MLSFTYMRNLKNKTGISLVVQWSRICLPTQGTWVRSPAGELRSHVPQGSQAYMLGHCCTWALRSLLMTPAAKSECDNGNPMSCNQDPDAATNAAK